MACILRFVTTTLQSNINLAYLKHECPQVIMMDEELDENMFSDEASAPSSPFTQRQFMLPSDSRQFTPSDSRPLAAGSSGDMLRKRSLYVSFIVIYSSVKGLTFTKHLLQWLFFFIHILSLEAIGRVWWKYQSQRSLLFDPLAVYQHGLMPFHVF